MGVAYRLQGRHKEAEELFIKSVAVDHDFLAGYHGLRMEYKDQGRLDEADSYFGRLVGQRPGWDFGHFMLGETHYDQKHFRKAINDYRNVVRLAPGQSVAYLKLGLSYLAVGETWSAEAQYGILRSLDKSNADRLREAIDRSTHLPSR